MNPRCACCRRDTGTPYIVRYVGINGAPVQWCLPCNYRHFGRPVVK